MSNLFFIILLVLGYIAWKLLDYFHLPNTFSILLLALTLICALFWCYNRFVLKPKRERQIMRTEQRTGRILSAEEKAKIHPVSELGDFLGSLFPIFAFIFLVRSFIVEPFQIPSPSMEPTLRIGDFLLVNKFSYGIKDPILQHQIIDGDKPQRGDVVVFKAPLEDNVDYIKRIIGVPGDRIQYNEQDRSLTITYSKEGKPCITDCETKQFSYSEPQFNEQLEVVIGQDRQGNLVYDGHPLELTETGDVSHQILWDEKNIYRGFQYRDYASQYNYITEWVVPEGQYFMMGDNRDHSYDSRFWGFVPEQNIVGKASYIWLSLDKRQNEWPTGIRFNRIFSKIQ